MHVPVGVPQVSVSRIRFRAGTPQAMLVLYALRRLVLTRGIAGAVDGRCFVQT